MKISNSKEEVISTKKASISFLNNTLEYYIQNDNLKKAQLIAKWLKDFSHYIRFEDSFDPTKNIAYKRGDIVKVNFGFNVGNELGGVHYAVVLDKNNLHRSGTIVVAPMSSAKEGEPVYQRDLFIGTEFYAALNQKCNKMLVEERSEIDNITSLLDILVKVQASDRNTPEFNEPFEKAKKRLNDLERKSDLLHQCLREISMMKSGSVVKIEQIRSVSKMRIWDPKNTYSILSGIHLSEVTMNKINDKLKELFVF